MLKEIVILTEGGSAFGFGHLVRTKSIAQAFYEIGIQAKFIINGDKSIINLLDDFSFTLLDWDKDLSQLFDILEKTNLILIDSIKISNKLIKKLESLTIKIIFIDDYTRRNILDNGIVIDWTVLSDEKNYFTPKKVGVTYLLGSKYTPLRKEFSHAKENLIKDKITSILVTFGGADVRNLSPKILKFLADYYPEMEKNIVIGAGFHNILEIQKVTDSKTNLIFNADTKMMIKLMQDSDIAIASGGQTLYELARIGTPTIAILLVENAKDDTDGWAKAGTIENIGWYDDEKLFEKLILKINLMQNRQIRQKMQDNGKKYIDSDGAKRLVKKILENI